MNEFESISNWSDYGILGLVIGALFCVIVIGFKLFMSFIEKQHLEYTNMLSENKKQTSEDFKFLHQQQKEERAEWSRESERREARSNESMRELTSAINQLKEKIQS